MEVISRGGRATAVALVALGAQVAVAAALAGSVTAVAIALSVLVLVPVLLRAPVALATLAFPLVYGTHRLGGGSFDLSFADATLVVMAAVSLRWVPWSSPLLRRMFLVLAGYLSVLFLTVVAEPTLRGVFEWLHRVELVAGALVIGSAVAAHGRARLALRGFLLASVVVAVAAVIHTLANDLEPAYPLEIHKNAAGFFLAGALIVVLCARRELSVDGRLLLLIQVALFGGLLACQARAAAATFAVIFLLQTMRSGRRSLIPLLGSVAVVVMAYSTTTAMLAEEDESAQQFNSFESRLSVFDRALDLWEEDPLLGAGLRFWRAPELVDEYGEPHNLFVSALGESGVVGTAAFVVFNGGFVVLLWRRRDELGRLALYLTIAHALDSMSGIFWVAGTGTLPWLAVGLAAGRTARAAEAQEGARSPGTVAEVRAPLAVVASR